MFSAKEEGLFMKGMYSSVHDCDNSAGKRNWTLRFSSARRVRPRKSRINKKIF